VREPHLFLTLTVNCQLGTAFLPAQLEGELEGPRIVSGARLSGVARSRDGIAEGLTSLTLNLLSMLKPSAITSRFNRSVTGNFLAIRKSIWKKPGRVKALRGDSPRNQTAATAR